jgi:hypothetical protein
MKRTVFAEELETTIIALGGSPGTAYEPQGWELWAPLDSNLTSPSGGQNAGAKWRRLPG